MESNNVIVSRQDSHYLVQFSYYCVGIVSGKRLPWCCCWQKQTQPQPTALSDSCCIFKSQTCIASDYEYLIVDLIHPSCRYGP
jgi:hypothetical protein